ncbi:MAG: LamG-like jellyroll fold domain-containing protein [Crocinitomicaceae bacterium]
MTKLLPILSAFFLMVFNAHAQTAGNALDFDGSDDYVDCPLPSVFNSIATNDFTIELWITPTVGTFQRVVFAQLDVNNFASISLNSAGEVSFYLQQNSLNQSVQSTDVVNSLELVHIAAVWNSSTQEAKIFINGNEASYAGGLFVSSTGTDGKMTVGSRTDGAQIFTGDMDELSIWSVAKTECEVSFEMNDKKSGSEPNLVVHYSFDQGIGEGSNPGVDELHDDTSVGNDGALMGFALSGNGSNWVTSIVNITRSWGDQSTLFLGQLGLVATVNADQYQWIYCSDLSPVPGATNSTFDPPTEDPNYTGVNDFYAVISTEGNCVDTSICYNVNGDVLSTHELELESAVSVYPNPSTGVFSIESSITVESFEIRNIAGQLIESKVPTQSGIIQFDLSEESGVYFVTISTESGILTKKILVQNL